MLSSLNKSIMHWHSSSFSKFG